MDIFNTIKNLLRIKGSESNPYSQKEYEDLRNKNLEGAIDTRGPSSYLVDKPVTSEQIKKGSRSEATLPDYVLESRIDGLRELIEKTDNSAEAIKYQDMINREEEKLRQRRFNKVDGILKK